MTPPEQHGCPHLAGTADPVHALDADFAQNPFPVLDELRAEGPVHLVRMPSGAERWLITRYDDVVAALADPRLSNELARGLQQSLPPEPLPPRWQVTLRTSRLLGRAMANLDPPDHDRLRKLVVRAFGARRVDGLRPRIERGADELFDAVEGLPRFDLVEAVANRLPVTVICELLGVPDSDADLFRTAASVLGGFQADDEAALRTVAALDAFDAYVRALVAERRATPGPDLLSELITTPADGSPLSDDELVSMAGLLLFGGYEPSAQLIGNTLLALLQHPDQLDALRADPSLLPRAVEEAIRYDGPVTPGLSRYALDDVEIGGTTIPKGSYVIVGVAAANRDPDHWADPDRFDLTRPDTTRQLGFGHGLHYCVGARLAALEVEIVLATALRRFPRLRLAVPAEQLRRRAGSVRGLVELPLRTD
ncbi:MULTISPECIES: cytochrome P450 [unclassified Streptomyces]|uniref:cytochrome P450 family protein n=1 Tax=unclassified Streptomyces TaxID=2593676 RepID=UPI0011E7F3EC|nr:cytochrome P450 [Streptomyces sp. sk2.1]TXS59577.1 cytochrome P450 [Streptomyces sp. sk2.1]